MGERSILFSGMTVCALLDSRANDEIRTRPMEARPPDCIQGSFEPWRYRSLFLCSSPPPVVMARFSRVTRQTAIRRIYLGFDGIRSTDTSGRAREDLGDNGRTDGAARPRFWRNARSKGLSERSRQCVAHVATVAVANAVGDITAAQLVAGQMRHPDL